MRAAISIPPAVSSEAGGIAQIARIKSLAALGRGSLEDLAERFGSARVQKAVSAMSTGNTSAAVDIQIIVGAFRQHLRNASAFYRLLDDMVRVPFYSRVSLVGTDATAWIVGEGKPIPVSRLTLEALHLEPKKAGSMLVLTEELLRNTQSERNLTMALRRAVAAVVDAQFFALVIDGDTPTIASAGSDAESIARDLKALLDAVKPTVESSLLFAMSPEVHRGAATALTNGGAFLFPGLTATGGEILGVPAMPVDGVGAGRVALLDASGIAGESGEIEIDASSEATIEMLATALQQDASTGAGTELVSLFETNSVALRVLTDFDAERLRTDAVAVLTGVEWGSAPEAGG